MDEKTVEKFTCAICQGVFDKDTPEEEAEAERVAYFGNVSKEDCELICDDCWEKVGLHKES